MYNYRDYNETAVRKQYIIKGLDLMNEGSVVDEARSPLLVNMWKDYDADGGMCLSSRPGSRIKYTVDTEGLKASDGSNIADGLVQTAEYNGKYVVRMGQILFLWNYTDDVTFTLVDGVVTPSADAVVITQSLSAAAFDRSDVRMPAVVYDNTFYYFDKDDGKIIYFREETDGTVTVDTFSASLPSAYPDEVTAPLVGINGNSAGGFDDNLPYNMLSRYYTVEYLAEKDVLAYKNAGSGVSLSVWLLSDDGVWTKKTDSVTVGADGIVFDEGHAPAEGTEFRAVFDRGSCEKDTVFGMRRYIVFDERVFAAVCDGEKLNRLYWSRAGNPLYWADTDYVTDSAGGAGIADLLPCGRYLSVLKRDVRGESGIFLHVPQDNDSELAPRIYPSVYGLHDVGALNALSAVNADGEAAFLSENGLNAIVSTDITSTASVEHRSSLVDRLLCKDIRSDAKYAKNGAARVFGFRGYICVYANTRVWMADTRQMFKNAGSKSTEYEWFKWDNVVPHTYTTGGATSLPVNIIDIFEDVDHVLAITARVGYRLYVFGFDAEGDVYLNSPYADKYPVLSVAATRFENYGYPNFIKKPLRRQGYAKIEGEDISVFCNTGGEYGEPSFRAYLGIPKNFVSLGTEAVSADISDSDLIYDIYVPRFSAMSVSFSSERPMKLYYSVNGAIVKEAVKFRWR